MALIDKIQHILLEIIGTLLILVGGLALVNLGFNVFPLKELSLINSIILLFIGLLLAGYRAIPQTVTNTIKVLRG